MKYFGKSWETVLLLFFVVFHVKSFAQGELETLFLSWKEDPTTTMTINWHTLEKMENDTLFYRLKGKSAWIGETPQMDQFPFSERLIYKVHLQNLDPDASFEFRIGGSDDIYWFKTMPRDIQDESVVFAIGGDTYDRDLKSPRHMWMERMNRTVMEYNPDFIVWGGDLAYADGREDQIWRWYGWFEAVKNSLIREDGKVVPIVVAIGNHEVNTSYSKWGDDYEESNAQRMASAPYFYSLFNFPGQPGYNVLDFTNYLSLIILDTDHTNPISGTQTAWLESVLSERKDVTNVFPVYHVPAYPSTKSDLNQPSSKRVREYWSKLFDEYNLSFAFEHHDHAYKRTFPIRNEKVDSSGIIYLGDGGWGTKVREPKDVDTTWYLEKTVRVRYALLVSLYKNQKHLLAIDEYGNTIDEHPKLFDRPYDPVKTNAVLIPEGGMAISAEFGYREGNVFLDSYYPGYTGGGYAWYETTGTAGVLKWRLPIAKSGKYKIRIRYANPIKPVTPQLFINGDKYQTEIEFTNTNSESDWIQTDFLEIDLIEGLNEVELECRDVSGLFVDGIEVIPSGE